jgi:hypothetical protein
METKHRDLGRDVKFGAPAPKPRVVQLPLFASIPDPIVEQLKLLDVEAMTPLEALVELAALKKKAAKPG